MSGQLDAITGPPDLPEGCDPTDPRFRRELVIEIAREQARMRLVDPHLLHTRGRKEEQ